MLLQTSKTCMPTVFRIITSKCVHLDEELQAVWLGPGVPHAPRQRSALASASEHYNACYYEESIYSPLQ